ncbi:MAG TPA: hypothetical protein DDX33_04030 [Rikenellaceae bacterium]|nr:hypothetical protein [Rikenellaceae bacterium]
MSRKANHTKAEIVAAGLRVISKNGESALTARSLAAALGCSTSPIFTIFNSIDEVKEAIHQAALESFREYVKDSVNYVPAFKEYGMRIVKFAKQDINIFKMVFLTKGAAAEGINEQVSLCLQAFQKDYSLTKEQSMTLIHQVWTFTCGLALLNAADAEEFTDDKISSMLSQQFLSCLYYIKSGNKLPEIMPRKRADGEESLTLPVPFAGPRES